MEQNALSSEPRYTPLGACAAVLLQPTAAVRRADHLPLFKAWVVHVAGLAMVLLVSVVLMGWSEALGRATAGDVIVASWDIAADLLGELDQVRGWVSLIFLVHVVEFGWIALAGITMAWSAGDESVRRCFERAYRRLLLLTPHVATIVAACGGLVVGIDRSYWQNTYDRVDLVDYIYLLMTVVTCLWLLWIVLRVVDCRPRVAVCRWPARCINCGYQLTGISQAKTCPECGQAVAETFDPQVRPGVALSRGVGGWLIQTYKAMRRPTALGERMHVLSPDTGYKQYLAYTVVMQMLGSVVGIALLFIIMNTIDEWLGFSLVFRWRDFLNVTLVGGAISGLFGVAVISVTVLSGSVVVGYLEGLVFGRNLMPAAARAACYLSGFMVLWSVVGWFNMAAFVACMELDLIKQLAIHLNVMIETIVFTWLGSVALMGLAIYLILVGRATRAARYANW